MLLWGLERTATRRRGASVGIEMRPRDGGGQRGKNEAASMGWWRSGGGPSSRSVEVGGRLLGWPLRLRRSFAGLGCGLWPDSGSWVWVWIWVLFLFLALFWRLGCLWSRAEVGAWRAARPPGRVHRHRLPRLMLWPEGGWWWRMTATTTAARRRDFRPCRWRGFRRFRRHMGPRRKGRRTGRRRCGRRRR